MAFRFALAPLLRLRQGVEQQCALSLQEASLQLSRGQEALRNLERMIRDSAVTDAARLTDARSAAELQFAALVRAQLDGICFQLENQINCLESIRDRAALAYQRAYREREVLESVRRRQHEAYLSEQARRQQRELDATYLIQHWHRLEG